MRTTASGLHRGNIGQVITVDQITSDDDSSESVVTGTLQAIERGANTVTLTIGVQEYELELDDTVDIYRSIVLAELFKMREENADAMLLELTREVLREVMRGEQPKSSESN